ncbi:MAG: DUF3604 domain-containing protein [Myxococcota bacterium]
MRKVAIALALLLAGAVIGVHALGLGFLGRDDSETLDPVRAARPPGSVREAMAAQRAAADAVGAEALASQILFGDLHAHTTISFDAFMLNMPILGGGGAAPPADACDFARHCAALDFWSINDHAANITAADWRNTIESIRRCNARAGGSEDPDLVSFLGWEWTQAGSTPDTHYGHKNVVLKHTDDARIPSRPIAATRGGVASDPPPTLARGLLALSDPRFRDLASRWTSLSQIDLCDDAPVRELPADCREVAATPAELFRKLDDWGHDAIVIPHGTAWGIYTPPRSTWDKQLEGAMHDPARQTLVEVYSGHGESEVYRDWRAVEIDGRGEPFCPAPVPGYMPTCWRAGQIIEDRCRAEGLGAEECRRRAEVARANAARAGISPHATVPGVTARELLDAGQCRDCEQPAFNYRPGGSAQYISAIGNFDDEGASPRRFRMGFIASSDIHSARPGTGYKEIRELSETPERERPEGGGVVASFLVGAPEEPGSRSRSLEEAREKLSGLQLYESERIRSYLYTGGLVAVHAAGRGREAIWEALEHKRVYGTSGPRILLWFDWLDGPESRPMGSEVVTRKPPVLRVRAVGSFEQSDGCPESTVAALGAARTETLCAGECYRPTDVRRAIRRIDVVRIRPQVHPDEDPADLIDDPWRSHACPDDPGGCSVTFVDDEFPERARDSVYYARVFETPSPTVNGRPPCRRWQDGRCVELEMCGDTGGCLGEYAHRAWSSPIWVDYAADPADGAGAAIRSSRRSR